MNDLGAETMKATSGNPWLESLLAGHEGLPTASASWVDVRRRGALEQAHALALPTRTDEAWRFTDLSSLYRMAFKVLGQSDPAGVRSVSADTPAVMGRIAAHQLPEAAHRLVFVDGIYEPGLSTACVAEGIRVCSLADVLAAAADPLHERVQGTLGRIAGTDDDALATLNMAFLQQGAVVSLERHAQLTGPLHLLFVSAQADIAAHPRVLVMLDAHAQAHIVEDHVSLHAGAGCVNAVTEILLGAGASLRHARIQRDSGAAFHIARCAVELQRDARYESVAIALGARLSRLDLDVHLRGEGAHASVDGLAMIAGGQLADTHTLIDHACAHGTSRQTHKVILAGNAQGVFNGRILVRPGAQQTDSSQQSRTLLLSDRARIDAKPQLEIFADDVKCAHGATVGQLEADELFYLVSRGIAPPAARRLLTFGFAADLINRLGIASLEQRLRELVLEQTESLRIPA